MSVELKKLKYAVAVNIIILCGLFYSLYYQYGENQLFIKEFKVRSVHELEFHLSFKNHVQTDSLINIKFAEELESLQSKLKAYMRLIEKRRWHTECGFPHSWDKKIEHIIDTRRFEVNHGL